MKNILTSTLIFAALIVSSCGNESPEKHETADKKAATSEPLKNTLSESGLKGPVKLQTTKVYRDLKQENDTWIIADTSVYEMSVIEYDQNGMSGQSESYKCKNGNCQLTQKTIIDIKDNKMAGSIAYDSEGKKIGTAMIKHVNDLNYISSTFSGDNKIVSKTEVHLDSLYRLQYEISQFGSSDQVMIKEVLYDDNGNISQFSFKGAEGKDTTDVLMKMKHDVVATDKMNNPEKTILAATGMQEGSYIITNSYEYYK